MRSGAVALGAGHFERSSAESEADWGVQAARSLMMIWRFPEIGVPPKSSI